MLDQDDRAYDREIAQLETLRRMRGTETSFPVFATQVSQLETMLTTGREAHGHPGTWDGTRDIEPLADDLVDDEELISSTEAATDEVGLCGNRLHPMTTDNRAAQGRCRICYNRARALRRATKPKCWTATHPAPEWGELCPCGNEPPAETFVDYVVVEDVLKKRPVLRELTNAEELCALVTVSRRWAGGMWASREWLWDNTTVRLSMDRMIYLASKWAPANGVTPMSATDVFLADMETAADPMSEPTAA